jgi:endo-1,3-1,4-beta-glycanase ExoK
MARVGIARIAVGAVAGLLAMLTLAGISSFAPAKADPTRSEAISGSPPGSAFLIDLRRGFDKRTQYLSDYKMDEDWIKVVYTPKNIQFDSTGMTLNLMRTGNALPYSGSEFQRQGTYGYGRYEVVMTASSAYGAVSSFFTYTGSHWGDPHDEIAIEFLGRNPREVYLNYFRDGVSHGVSIPLWFDTTLGDHIYAFEWGPNSIRWYADGIKIREVTLADSKTGIPRTTGRVMANLWAGAGPTTHWTGLASFERTKATYRCMSHLPMGKSGLQCSDKAHPARR